MIIKDKVVEELPANREQGDSNGAKATQTRKMKERTL